MNGFKLVSLRSALVFMALLVLIGACSGGGSTRKTSEEREPCPSWDLRTPCGKDAAGNYYKLLN